MLALEGLSSKSSPVNLRACPSFQTTFATQRRRQTDSLYTNDGLPHSQRPTHVVDAVDEGVTAAVGHGQPVGAEEDDVDVAESEGIITG